MSQKRLEKEIQWMEEDQTEGISARPLDNDLYNWRATISGPLCSPYAGGLFCLNFEFPKAYPFQPPKVNFSTKIYHPNVNFNGYIDVDILKGMWSPALRVPTILKSIRSLIACPDADVPLVKDIAEVFKSDRQKFNDVAREWTIKYAG